MPPRGSSRAKVVGRQGTGRDRNNDENNAANSQQDNFRAAKQVAGGDKRAATQRATPTPTPTPLKMGVHMPGNTQQYNPIFDVDGSCMNPTPEGRLLRDKAVYSEVFVISKKMYEVHGKAYQCKKEIIQMITSENFFGAKSKEISKVQVEMTPTECETMVKDKK